MMELMQKYVMDGGAVGINNLKYWEKCSAAIEFLSAITSAGSFEELKWVRIQPLDFESCLLVRSSAS
jgi:hypothetical protein